MTEVDQTTPRPPPRPLLVLIEFIIKIVMTYSHPIRRGIKNCFFFRKCLFAHSVCGRSVLFAHSPGYLLSCNYMILCNPAAAAATSAEQV